MPCKIRVEYISQPPTRPSMPHAKIQYGYTIPRESVSYTVINSMTCENTVVDQEYASCTSSVCTR